MTAWELAGRQKSLLLPNRWILHFLHLRLFRPWIIMLDIYSPAASGKEMQRVSNCHQLTTSCDADRSGAIGFRLASGMAVLDGCATDMRSVNLEIAA